MFKSFTQWLEEKGLNEDGLPKDIEAAREEPGGSNVGKERETSGKTAKHFCGPAGGAPKGSYPIDNPGQVRAAKSYARHAPNPEGIKRCAAKVAREEGWGDGEKD